MKLKRAWIIARLDLARLVRSKDYLVPLIILAGIFFVIIPWVMLGVVSNAGGSALIQQIGGVLESLPQIAQNNVRGNTPQARAAYAFSVYLLAPVAIVVPLTISSAIGAYGLIGDREKGTGEYLAHSPLHTSEIFYGKLIAAFIPGYLATVAGFGLYALIVNTRVGHLLGGWFFPTPEWWILIFWVVPPFIIFSLGVILWASGRVQSAPAAQQASTLVTLPVIILAYGVTSGLALDPVRGAIGIGAAAWVVALVVLRITSRGLKRERLLGTSSQN